LPIASRSAAASAAPAGDAGRSFRGILKSSALIGASSVITMVVGALRTKALAVLLGPAGMGLLGAFTMILELARNVAELGLTSSGVRQIAEAASSEGERRLAVTALVLKRTTLCCGVLGAVVLWWASAAVSRLVFASSEHATAVSLLAFALLFSVMAGGQGALLQGTRNIRALAKVTVYGALLGSLAAVLIVYATGDAGIVPSLVATAITSVALSWWYVRRVRVAKVVLQPGEAIRESAMLFKLGLAFLASGLLMTGASFAVRTFVIRTLGLEAAGVYQAAWALGGLYVGVVLQSLGMDFYPRLVGIAHDHPTCNAMVNQQTQASLLLAAPGILATITFAPLVIDAFYSEEFGGAVVLLRWFCMGMALRVITWPIGFIIVAKNRQVAFFAVEAVWALFNIVATWWAIGAFGLEGAGIAFMLSYVIHALIVYPIVRSMTGFRWSDENMRNGSIFLVVCMGNLLIQRAFSHWLALAVGTGISLLSLWFSLRMLARLSSADVGLPGLRRLLRLGRNV
jgi:PST family polysaccharide transporter